MPRYLILALLAMAVPLLIGQQFPASITQSMGAPSLPNVSGLDKPEQGENGAFRWSNGPVNIDLQPLGYPLHTRLLVQGVRPEGVAPAQVALEAGGKPLLAQELARSPQQLEVKLPASEAFSINPRLIFTSTLFQVPGDRRQLGAVFYSMEQRSGPGPSLPSVWPALWILLSGPLLFAAVYRATRKPQPPVVACILWGVAAGLLNAVARPWLVFYSLYFVVPPLVVLFVLPWLRALREHRQPSPSRQAEPAITSSPGLVSGLVTAFALAMLAWHLLARSVPEGKSATDNLAWGVSFYGVLPLPLQVLGVFVVLASVAWAWLAPLEAEDESGSLPEPGVQGTTLRVGQRGRLSLVAQHPMLVASTLSLALFALLPVQYAEGDSSEFDRKIPVGAIWRERELLDFYAKSKLWLLLRGWVPKPSQVYVAVATLAGAVYAAGAVLLGKTLGRNTREMWVFVAALLAVGNVLLYFGYVESYALVQVTSLFVLWACWQYTRGLVPFGTVGALATLAPLLHGSALWWGPMVVAAWLLRARSLPATSRWKVAFGELWQGIGVGLAMSLLMVAVAAIDGYDWERFQAGLGELGGLDGRTMLPLFTPVSPYERYVYFSWPHLGAVIQEQFLTAPLALLTIILVLVVAGRGILRLARATPSLTTLGVGAASMFFYSTAWNPDLGPRDDWDLLSLSALPLTLLAIYLLTRLPYGVPRRLALTSFISVSAIHAAAWVYIHVVGLHL